MEKSKIKHPAVYSDQFLSVFFEKVKHMDVIYDPFAGTGKIAKIKDFGYNGKIICNDLEPEYSKLQTYKVDKWLFQDAETAIPGGAIEAIVTSPTYGNRMADSHNAKDLSKRITYTHQLGRKLTGGNTGSMQWGTAYKEKHCRCYVHFYNLLANNGLLILNVSNHIRKGQLIDVTAFHKAAAIAAGFIFIECIDVPVRRMRFGANHKLRVETEQILIFKRFI